MFLTLLWVTDDEPCDSMIEPYVNFSASASKLANATVNHKYC